jgi:branched-chain amino acid transport system ATP-binding protein
MPILRTRALVKRFGGLLAINEVDFEVNEGEIVGLIGPNGAGKTTFVNLLTGELTCTSGEIEYRGQSIKHLPAHHRSRLGMSRTFQIPQPFADLTIRENVMIGSLFGKAERDSYSMANAAAHANRILLRVGLDKVGDRPTSWLTTAGLKRLEVARCLATDPSLLFLDEPLGGLNASETKDAIELIRELRNSGITIVFIEHIIPAVVAVSDRIVVLANGSKLASGAPQEVTSNPDVQRAYLGDIGGAIERYARARRNGRACAESND